MGIYILQYWVPGRWWGARERLRKRYWEISPAGTEWRSISRQPDQEDKKTMFIKKGEWGQLGRGGPGGRWYALQRQNAENLKQIFPEKEYRGLSPNFHIHVSVSELYIPTIGLPVLLEEICRLILGIYKSLKDTWMWNCGVGRAIPRKGIYKWNCRCSVGIKREWWCVWI